MSASRPKSEDPSLSRIVLLLFGFSACWLVAGSFLAFLAACKLVWPGFLDGPCWLTYGRIAPAALDALVYGWASSAGFGVTFWLLAQLGQARLLNNMVPVVAAIFWQIAVLFGLCGILAGYGHSALLLEFPTFVGPLLFVAYLGLAVWAYLLFRTRIVRGLFASTWYLIGALLWFPWIYFTGWALLVWEPVSGSAQAPLGAWFSGGVANLWLAPLALAGICYLVPQLIGRRLVAYNLSLLAFWSFALFSNWAGLVSLIGGPVPAWMASAGEVAAVLLFIPVLILGLNIFGAIHRAAPDFAWSPPLRFAVVAAAAFLGVYFEGGLLALPDVSGLFHFTDVVLGQGVLFLGGLVSFSFFALIYHALPRVRGSRSSDTHLISWHYTFALVGVLGLFVCFTIGGVVQAFAQADPGVDFVASLSFVAPFRFLAVLCVLSFFVGSLCFATWLFRVFWNHLLSAEPPAP